MKRRDSRSSPHEGSDTQDLMHKTQYTELLRIVIMPQQHFSYRGLSLAMVSRVSRRSQALGFRVEGMPVTWQW